ncbi:sporulation membrane protein YtrI [Caenibacillus caldisaponilyticus]|jgi:hypothetical protein|uniref:sporulation membrane protein YtrI n=1 Tax=Caenibacillus caldisaponilyticus TaxID=1674942 RepID=UPI00098884C9|nr:sporulation membrane protein YtrI [Caenibacillus caldisaponilyticus]
MRIPPYYRHPDWQRFFAGIAVGAIIGFCFFILIYGLMQERQIEKIQRQQNQIEDLARDYRTLIEEREKENEALEKQLRVQEIRVDIRTEKEPVDQMIKLELKQAIAEQLQVLITKNIAAVAENHELIFRTIESHPFVVEDKRYYFKVRTLVVFTAVEVGVVLTKVETDYD